MNEESELYLVTLTLSVKTTKEKAHEAAPKALMAAIKTLKEVIGEQTTDNYFVMGGAKAGPTPAHEVTELGEKWSTVLEDRETIERDLARVRDLKEQV